MAAIRDAMLAVDRWATVNPEMAQLLIGRPIPGYIPAPDARSEEHTSELQSLMRISYAVFCFKQKSQAIALSHPQEVPLGHLRHRREGERRLTQQLPKSNIYNPTH